MRVRFRPLHLLRIFFVLAAAGCSSDPKEERQTQDGTPPPPPASCTKPETGLYRAVVGAKNSCPWWDESDVRQTMHVLAESVRYPHTDDVCGDVQWEGCTLRDACGPMKLDTGSQGWIGRGALAITFTDDTHFTGTVTYDIGHACKMELDVTGEKLL